MKPNLKSICVFCGSNVGRNPRFREAARAIGKGVAEKGITGVYGGGGVGLMKVFADSVLGRGGKIIGVIPEMLFQKEVGHAGLTELHRVSSMHERKKMMYDLSDGFIALPGGFGTFEEILEIITWGQLGLHSKPCGVLNIDGYYDAFLTQIEKGTQEALIRPEHRALILIERDPLALLEKMESFQPAHVEKWINEDEV
ncbi:MAG: TIGR00730 family Rossman fold protein [Deltaproteobacteria bacterium]|nr:TIGR00730 family Rossman fold protein [Deltaproteobacteria bacterium]